MKTATRNPQSPESYGTFWEPLPIEVTPPTPVATAADSAEAKDAYLEFVNVTEDSPASLRADRN